MDSDSHSLSPEGDAGGAQYLSIQVKIKQHKNIQGAKSYDYKVILTDIQKKIKGCKKFNR